MRGVSWCIRWGNIGNIGTLSVPNVIRILQGHELSQSRLPPVAS